MPELPEVESLIRSLKPLVVGQRVLSVAVNKPKLVSSSGNIRRASAKKVKEFTEKLKGEDIADIQRRAKNIIFIFRSGKVAVAHLKMTGQLVYQEKGKTKAEGGHPIELSEMHLPNIHSHIIFRLAKGALYYNDTRMFGYILYYPSIEDAEKAEHFKNYGIDPLSHEFTEEKFAAELMKKKGVLKSVLMGQEVVTGLGNIYCDETCFEAKVRPTRKVITLKKEEIARLYKAIKKILSHAIALGGSSVATYRLADGSRGNYAKEHKVYGRGGEECVKCGNKLVRASINNRTTVYCLHCQK